MNKCCSKWKSKDIVRTIPHKPGEETVSGAIEHLFKYCPECGNKLRKEEPC